MPGRRRVPNLHCHRYQLGHLIKKPKLLQLVRVVGVPPGGTTSAAAGAKRCRSKGHGGASGPVLSGAAERFKAVGTRHAVTGFAALQGHLQAENLIVRRADGHGYIDSSVHWAASPIFASCRHCATRSVGKLGAEDETQHAGKTTPEGECKKGALSCKSWLFVAVCVLISERLMQNKPNRTRWMVCCHVYVWKHYRTTEACQSAKLCDITVLAAHYTSSIWTCC